MKRSLRWQTWLTRFLLLGVVALAAQFGLGLAARSFAIRSGKSILGAPLELRSSRVSVWNRQVVLNDLQVVNPHNPAMNIVEADRCELDLSPEPLLFKQVVVNNGSVSGLRFAAFVEGTAQSNDKTSESNAAKWFHDESDDVANQWFSHLAERLQQDGTNQLESVRRTEAFCATWAQRFAALDSRGDNLDQEAANLQHGLDAAQANPLRAGTFLADLPLKVAALQKRFAELSSDLQSIPDQIETERRAIVAARRRDEQLATTPVAIEAVESDAISGYLLREEASKPLADLFTLLRWVRETIPAEPAKPHAKRRGEDILFAGCEERPNILIRALALQGSARIANQPIELQGVLHDFTTSPTLHSEPMRLRLQAAGSLPIQLQATINRTPGKILDAIVMDCQGVLLPELKLGRTGNVAVGLSPSIGSLSISVAAEGDKVTGEIQLVQRNVHVISANGGELSDPAIAAALEDSLSHVESFATRVSISGTLAEPTCTLWSNLGSAVAEAMEHAVERAKGQRTRSLMVEASKHGDEQLTAIEQQMSEQQARWKTRIAAASAQIQTVADIGTASDRQSLDRLGRRLPSNSLVR
ncbi:MAG TPA: hypothetical protein VHU84_18005 [Lacipirellulaceae bacterium]|jgi:uncharacterized protein (TIGR03545 family)|nr:hypothetical protein [Lacipirellulaceae bacterium]